MNRALSFSFLVTVLYFGLGAVLLTLGFAFARAEGMAGALAVFALLTWRAIHILFDCWAGVNE